MSEISWVRVEGESMRPFLQPGDGIEVEWLKDIGVAVPLCPGEVVLGRSDGGEWIVHRVISTDGLGSRWVIKGDASYSSELLESRQIWGRVRAIRKQSPDSGAPSHLFEPSWLDRLIASASGRSLPPELWGARVARKLTSMLGAFRRKFL